MAKIIDNIHGRRLIRLSTDDIISIVKEYQTIVCNTQNYETIRKILNNKDLYIPEDC